LYQFHAQQALFKIPKIYSMNFWNFSENSSNLAQPSFPLAAVHSAVPAPSLMVFFTAMGSDGHSPKNVFYAFLEGKPL